MAESNIPDNFKIYYEKCKKISKFNSKSKLLVFEEFYKFYTLFINRLDQQQRRSNHSKNKTQDTKNKLSKSINIIKKAITIKKKEVDEILFANFLNNKNRSLPFKKLANNKALEYNMEQLQQSSNNNSLFQPSELNILRQKKLNNKITNNENKRLQELENSFNKSELKRLQQNIREEQENIREEQAKKREEQVKLDPRYPWIPNKTPQYYL
jgi:hypothetical protein